MDKTLKAVLIILAVIVAGSGLFVVGQAYGQAQGANGYGIWRMPMLVGRDRGVDQFNSGPMMRSQRAWSNDGFGYGPRMGPMMGGYGYGPGITASSEPLTVTEVKWAAEKYLKEMDIEGLKTSEIMIFDNNAYIVIEETDTGLGAFELLIDPVSKLAYPEFGPNMMWNLKYGALNHGGMLGGGGMGWMMRGYGRSWNANPSDISAEMTVSEVQASGAAQSYLDDTLPGHTVSDHATRFYGYYTFDFEKDGKIVGMLSVNGFNGDVFVHSWHGTFIEEAE